MRGPARICSVSESILRQTIPESCAGLLSLAAQQATFDRLATATVQCLRAGNKAHTLILHALLEVVERAFPA